MDYIASAPSAQIPVAAIQVNRGVRQRREFTTTDLELSFKRKGQIHPIVVRDNGDGTYLLIAGERRLTAAQRLEWEFIRVQFSNQLSDVDLKMLELEENIKRLDLSWQDRMDAVKTLHELYISLDPDWTQSQTAEAIGLADGHVSEYLRVAALVEAKPELLTKKTQREAYNAVRRNENRQMGNALEELFADIKQSMEPDQRQALETDEQTTAKAAAEAKKSAPEEIIQRSFLDWAPTYEGDKFNFIHCDFPFGVNLFDGEFGSRAVEKTYRDEKSTYFALLDCLLDNLDRVLSLSGHVMFWHSEKFGQETRERFRIKAPSLAIATHSLIWHKTDNAGIIGDARRDFRHVYETALIARRGERQLVKSVGDVYGCPTDRTLHPSAKPEPMLRHFFSSLVDEHTTLLDPTCGAGSALRAADSLGAKQVLGLEIEPQFVDVAKVALRNARTLRTAARSL